MLAVSFTDQHQNEAGRLGEVHGLQSIVTTSYVKQGAAAQSGIIADGITDGFRTEENPAEAYQCEGDAAL